MSQENGTIVRTEELSKIYQNGTEVRALDGVSIEVGQGEFLAVTGPSGSGKSTLLNLIGTLDAPSKGRVYVGGVDVATLKGDELADFRRKRVGFVFQLFNLVPVLSALENVMLPMLPYRRKLGYKLEERARQLLETVGLGERLTHSPAQLSGGEQQRVAIARALVNEPVIVLADEPTGNLDSKAGEEIMKLLGGICSQGGRSVLVVTHDPQVSAYADRIYHLRDGKVVKQ